MKRMLALITLFGVLTYGGTAKAMTVFDPSNLAENIISAQEAVKQTAQMIEQYKTQLLQYERMLKDALSLPDFVTGDLKRYLTEIQDTQTNVISKVSGLLGTGGGSSGSGLQQILDAFHSPTQFASNQSIYTNRDKIQSVLKSEVTGQELTKSYADATLEVADNQVKALPDFQERFTRVLDDSRNAEGHLQAMQSQTELLSLILEMLGNIHQLMVADSSMNAARHETMVSKEARERMVTAIIAGKSSIFESQTNQGEAKEHSFFNYGAN